METGLDSEAYSSLVFTVTRQTDELIKALHVFKDFEADLEHLESRPSKTASGDHCDYFIEFRSRKIGVELIEKLKAIVIAVAPLGECPISECSSCSPTLLFPKTISEVRRCCAALAKYGGELTPDHPGYGDDEYIKRRREIADIALQYEYGNPYPKLTYTKEEIETWNKVFTSQQKLYSTHACKEYNTHIVSLFKECGFREGNIPQLGDVSNFLKSKTGWQLWPVIGWISSRDFLNALAFRVFPTTQYMRHSSSPFYTPEPDLCHELMGHAPLFCDPNFAQFSQDIGLASLGISDEWIAKLTALYWFTVEYGLVDEGGVPKAYGAGLISSNEELQYCRSDKPIRKKFDIDECLVTKYPEAGFQPLYFVANSLEDMRIKISEFTNSIPRPFTASYDHNKDSLEIIPNESI